MGAKTSLLAFVEGDAVAILKSAPRLDREASRAALARLFPGEVFEPLEDGSLFWTYPPKNEVMIGCFPGLTILADDSVVNNPANLDRRFLDFANGRTILQHIMISTVDAFAYGVWEKGELRRYLDMDADHGVNEDVGTRRAFEEPFWVGEHFDAEINDGEYAGGIPFHPLEMAEAALLDLFGYQLEGEIDAGQVQPETIPLMRFARVRAKPWWKIW